MDFYVTRHYPCSYLSDRLARSRIAIASDASDSKTYAQLIKQGYRRSGSFIYRPDCGQCHACIPVRIMVDQFKPNRTQRRIWKQHRHLQVVHHPLHYDPEHLALYQRYQKRRHAGGTMDHDDHQQYSDFLLTSNVNSRLVTFHEDRQLRMVSIVDQLPDGLSSVYTFFDPDVIGSSYGTYSILWQAAHCQIKCLPYVYLGYWIAENQKMRYKTNFQPLQCLLDGQWQSMEAAHSY